MAFMTRSATYTNRYDNKYEEFDDGIMRNREQFVPSQIQSFVVWTYPTCVRIKLNNEIFLMAAAYEERK